MDKPPESGVDLAIPLIIGNVTLPNRVFYAPLAGCSDFPFRQMSAKYGRPGLMFCEMVKMEPLVRGDPKTLKILDYNTDMYPIGAQICGSKAALAGPSARIIEELGFTVVDLNCGCPVDKVTKDGSGSGMLRDPSRIGDVVSAMVAAVNIPVTVKIRIGWDDDTINVVEVAQVISDAGASALTIHGRTRQQGYTGPARWEYIRAVKEALPSLTLIGNGDLFAAPNAGAMTSMTGCDAVLVARGTMGQPWIAQDILRWQRGIVTTTPTVEEVRAALYEHFEYTAAYREAHYANLDMRRVGCWYFKKAPGTKTFREQISKATNLDDVRRLIREYPFQPFNDGTVSDDHDTNDTSNSSNSTSGQKPHVQAHAIAKGKVQGVGFRYTVWRHAERLQICGTAENLADGSVEIYAQGTRDAVEAFLSALRTHAGLARVDHLSVTWQRVEVPMQGFSIL